jgi:hypothetical protein
MTTYELTAGTREEFEEVKTQLISEFIQQVTGAEVDNQLLGHGSIVSCLNACNTLESLIFTVHYDLDETKNYGAAVALSSGSLKFVDMNLDTVWDDFVVAQYKLKSQYNKFVEDDRRREKEAQKLEKKRKENEKKMAGMKVSAEKEFNNLLDEAGKKVTETDEFYWTLGWLAKHVGTITAKMPDFLEAAFVKHFGDVEHTAVDSTKVGPAGYTSQWRLSMEASLVKAKEIPATLTQYLNPTGKKLSKTSFIWKLVDDYGFKFGKKQDTLDIMRCVPIEYVPMFNEGLKA